MRSFRAPGALALSALTAVSALALSACSAEETGDGSAQYKDFALTGKRLTIVADARVDLVGARSGAERVAVTRWFKASKVTGRAEAHWSMEQDGTLRLTSTCSGFVVDCALRHRVEIPRGVAVTVRASGDSRVLAKGLADPLKVRTTDGNINITDTTGPLDLSSARGSVRAERLGSSRAEARTTDGHLVLSFRTPPATVETRARSGRTTITVPPADYRVHTKAHAPTRVRTTVPHHKNAPHKITATTENGPLTLRTP